MKKLKSLIASVTPVSSDVLSLITLMEYIQELGQGISTLLDKEIFEPRYEKTGLLGFRPGPTQTGP